LGISQHLFNTLTVSVDGLMLLQSHPSLATQLNGPLDGSTYILGNTFVVDVNFTQDHNRVYLGTVDNYKEGCILMDNFEEHGVN
jgi:hypothetical protein